MTLVADGLHLIGVGIVNVYLLETQEGLVLVDAGTPGSETKILAAMAKLGFAPDRLKHIVITHVHPDHVGGAAAMARATGAQTWMHALDAPLAERGQLRPLHPRPGILPALLFAAMRLAPRDYPLAPIDHKIEGEETTLPFGGLRAVRAPGHCLGQVVLLWPSRRALIAADACVNLFGLALPPVNEDVGVAAQSLKRVATLDFDLAVFGHGRPILKDASAQMRGFAAKL